MLRIRRDDTVMVMVGKDKGKTGKVIEVNRKANKVTVEAINIHHRFEKKRSGTAGQKITFPAGMPAGKVMLVCPSCGKQTRIGHKFLENGTKQRVCKKCEKAI